MDTGIFLLTASLLFAETQKRYMGKIKTTDHADLNDSDQTIFQENMSMNITKPIWHNPKITSQSNEISLNKPGILPQQMNNTWSCPTIPLGSLFCVYLCSRIFTKRIQTNKNNTALWLAHIKHLCGLLGDQSYCLEISRTWLEGNNNVRTTLKNNSCFLLFCC